MRILAVKLSSLGDILHALPAVHALHDALRADIDWAVQCEYAGLVECFTDVSRVIPVQRHAPWRGIHAWTDMLRAHTYDVAIDFQGLLKSAMVTRLARAQRRIGPSFNREGARRFYDDVAGPRNPHRHAIEQNLDILDLFDIPRPTDPKFPMRLPAPSLNLPHPIVGLAPVSRWPSKNWPESHYAALAGMLGADRDASVVLLGGAADEAPCRRIAAACSTPVRNLCGSLTLAELAAVLSELDVLVSNDSGPVHLAAAVGTTCVVVFGPTAPERIGPWGSRHRILVPPVACTCRGRRRCRRHDGHCLASLTPEQVFETVDPLLSS